MSAPDGPVVLVEFEHPDNFDQRLRVVQDGDTVSVERRMGFDALGNTRWVDAEMEPPVGHVTTPARWVEIIVLALLDERADASTSADVDSAKSRQKVAYLTDKLAVRDRALAMLEAEARRAREATS